MNGRAKRARRSADDGAASGSGSTVRVPCGMDQCSDGGACFHPWSWTTSISATTLNALTTRSSRGDFVKVVHSAAPRLWMNVGQAVVRSVTGIRRDGSRTRVVSKCARTGRKVRRAGRRGWHYAKSPAVANRRGEVKRRVKERSFVAEIAFLRLATALPEGLRERMRVPRLLHAAAGLLAPRDDVSESQAVAGFLLVERPLPLPTTCAPCGDFAGVGAPLSAIDDALWDAMPPLRPTAFAMLMEDVRYTAFAADRSAANAVVSVQRGGEADSWTLPNEHAQSAVQWLAALHSIPWRRRGADVTPLWEDGTYWNLSKVSLYFIYRYISCESCSQFDSPPSSIFYYRSAVVSSTASLRRSGGVQRGRRSTRQTLRRTQRTRRVRWTGAAARNPSTSSSCGRQAASRRLPRASLMPRPCSIDISTIRAQRGKGGLRARFFMEI